jgi:4-amino-4-deoxy-L-arabinose transferase-like glycosyltransferase
MIFWTASMYFISKIFEDENVGKYWILFGLAAGLAIMSKVHSVFLWEGVFLYAVLYKRTIFKEPYFYIAVIVTATIISPILCWNIANDFITYRFHSARVIENGSTTFQWFGLLKELIGQVVINNPFNIAFVLFFFGVQKNNPKASSPLTVFTLIALPLLAIICYLALFRTTLPHWSGPAYITLIPMAAIGLSNINLVKINLVLKVAGAYFLFFVMFIIYAVNFYPGSFGSKTQNDLGKNDISLDAFGWKQAGEKFATIYNADNANKPAKEKPPLVCVTWWGAHDEYYFALPLGIKMIGLGSTQNIHQYAWKNKFDSVDIKMDTAYCLMHSYDYVNVKNAYADYYKNIDSVANIKVMRSNVEAYNFVVYKLSGFKQR